MKPFQANVSSRYGAPMGRRSDSITGKVELSIVPMFDGDYDEGGAYWGGGSDIDPLWCAWNDDGACYFRAPNRQAAVAHLAEAGCEAPLAVRETIIGEIAGMLWAQAFITWADEDKGRPRPGPGGSWDPLVPPTPDTVHAAAVKLAEAIERLNDAPLDVLYQRAADMPGKHYREPTAERFGICIGFRAAQAGVGWADDHPDPKYKIPEVEVYTDDGETADVGRIDERFAR